MANADESHSKRLAERARLLLARIELMPDARDDLFEQAYELAEEMKSARAMPELGHLTDRLRLYPGVDPLVHTLQAQALVDLGMPAAARDLLASVSRAFVPDTNAWREFQGLKGRVNKQIFIDSPDKTAPMAIAALIAAIKAYQAAFERDPNNSWWHGINVVALLAKARRMGRRIASSLEPAEVAAGVCAALDRVPAEKRDVWWHATYAEAELARLDLDRFVRHLKSFIEVSKTNAFALNSFLRQLTEIWDLEHDARVPDGGALIGLLRAELLSRENIVVKVPVGEIPSAPATADVAGALQKTFGQNAPIQLRWWELGRTRARAVAALYGPDRAGFEKRWGTGFLVHARAAGTQEAAKPYLLTNAHVLGDPEAGIRAPEAATIRFEGHDPGKVHRVASIVWTSAPTRLDATLLELDPPPSEIEPIPLFRTLPRPGARLYVIGHAYGDELAFSFQDNDLLDHEGPPCQVLRRPPAILVHYRTPTEEGNSGSPVFLETQWLAIALHHSGLEAGMYKLNGKPGKYSANEGIALSSISDALTDERAIELIFV
jgi:Trypsin-like peptidase domain/MAP3K TRAFs-binding domain